MSLDSLEALVVGCVAHHAHPVRVGDVRGEAAELLLLLLLLGLVDLVLHLIRQLLRSSFGIFTKTPDKFREGSLLLGLANLEV